MWKNYSQSIKSHWQYTCSACARAQCAPADQREGFVLPWENTGSGSVFFPRLVSYWGLNKPADYLRAFKCKLGYAKPSLKTLSFAPQIIDGLKRNFGYRPPNKLQARGFLQHEPCMERFIHCVCARTSCSCDNKAAGLWGEICICQRVHVHLPAHAVFKRLLY